VRLAKFLSAVGRTCITAGVLILLFVAYQLWGTGIREAQAQDRLENEFNSKLSQSSESDGAIVGSSTTTTTTAGPTETLPITTAPSTPPPGEGDAVGKIEIPDISLSAYVVEGVADGDLHNGPGHYPATPLPGQQGNAAVAGHRTTYGAPFASIDELHAVDSSHTKGSVITVTTVQGTFHYEVISCGAWMDARTKAAGLDKLPAGIQCDDPASGHIIVSPSAIQVLDQIPNENLLTLTACHPKYSASKRIVVFARLAGDEVAKPATPRAVDAPKPVLDSLSGKRAPKLPAILYGLLCAAIWIAAWRIGKLWRKWPAYFIGFPIFLIALFFFFENFSRLLPSNY